MSNLPWTREMDDSTHEPPVNPADEIRKCLRCECEPADADGDYCGDCELIRSELAESDATRGGGG